MELKRTDILHDFYYVLSFGYCDLQTIATEGLKVGYTRGVYGWNCDIYKSFNYGGVAISTGYRTIKQNDHLDYKLKNAIINHFANKKQLLNSYREYNLNFIDFIDYCAGLNASIHCYIEYKDNSYIEDIKKDLKMINYDIKDIEALKKYINSDTEN